MDSGLLYAEPTLEDAGGNEELFGYLKTAREHISHFFDIYDSADWAVAYDTDGVTLWSKDHESSSFQYGKREMEVNTSAENLVKLLRDPEFMKSWDDKLKEFEYAFEFDTKHRILKIRIAGSLVVSDRAVVAFATNKQLTDGSFVFTFFSVDTDKVEVDSACVVAKSIFVTRIQPISETSCKATNVFHTEPGGSIPAMLVNSFVKDRHTQWVRIKEKAESS